ncbi:MAG: hypothetical protein U0270_46420 [Labilithrix sp.]
MDDLGEVFEEDGTELEELLALQIQLASFATPAHCRDVRAAMTWQCRPCSALEEALMNRFEAAGDDTNGDAERTKASALSCEADARNNAGRSRRAHGIDVNVPLGELLREVVIVKEAPLLEEGAIDPLHEIFDGALLLTARGPTDFDADAHREHRLREGRVVFDDDSVSPRLHDRLRLLKDSDERNAAEALEVHDERAHDRLGLLVLHERHVDVASSTSAAWRRSGHAGSRR